MVEYSESQKRFFEEKDRRITIIAIIKSYIEHHGKLPPKEFIEGGLELIYGKQEESTDDSKAF